MRNKDRIKPFMQELATIWEEECPDWRFGQLIINVLSGINPMYMEEDEMLDYFKKYFKRGDEK